jgi:methylase of polypeptide subunit release factors
MTAPLPDYDFGDAPLRLDRAEAFRQLRDHFQRLGFSQEGMEKAFGFKESAVKTNIQLTTARMRLGRGTPLAWMVLLFRFGAPLSGEEVKGAFAPLKLEPYVEAGLLKIHDDGTVSSPFAVDIYDGMYCFYDRISHPTFVNNVLGISVAATTVAEFTIRKPVDRALDLGTGNGILALLAGRHAKYVIGTDINARALNVARVNAQMNGLDNVEFRQGSWWDPVAGEQFDLITCNPPYVISPESRFMFRDSGLEGDGVTRMLAETIPEHLRDGGTGSMTGNWSCAPPDWADPPRRWLEGKGVDALILMGGIVDPLEYAIRWVTVQEKHASQAVLENTIHDWLKYYHRLRIPAIASGALVLRKQGEFPKELRALEVDPGPCPPCGPALERFFRLTDYLRSLPDLDALLACRFRPAPGHHVEQFHQFNDGYYQILRCQLRTDGPRFVEQLATDALQYFLSFDGQRTLRDALQKVAEQHQVPLEATVPSGLEMVRGWLDKGFLIPVDLT